MTVDTEFMRERTYWPELCVVQLAGEAEVAVIDAQAPGIDLAPLGALLADTAVTKVFHAARQDIEIFVLQFGDMPRPMFDTQVAAMVAGFGDQVGYDALVSGLTGGQIDKAHRFSDWSARPLSPAQIDYAAADVTHLRGVYVRVLRAAGTDGRLEWVAEEMAVLADPATYRPDPETIWERLRPRTNNRRVLGMLRAIARLARAGGAAQQHPAPADAEGREPAGDRRHRARHARGAGPRPRRDPRLRRGQDGRSLLAVIARREALPEGACCRSCGAPRRPAAIAGAGRRCSKCCWRPNASEHHVAPRLVADRRTSTGSRRGSARHAAAAWLAARDVRRRRGRPQGGTRVAGGVSTGRGFGSCASAWVSAFAC